MKNLTLELCQLPDGSLVLKRTPEQIDETILTAMLQYTQEQAHVDRLYGLVVTYDEGRTRVFQYYYLFNGEFYASIDTKQVLDLIICKEV